MKMLALIIAFFLLFTEIDGAGDEIEGTSGSSNQPNIGEPRAPKKDSKKAKFESVESTVKRIDSQLDLEIKKNRGNDDVGENLNMLAPQIEEFESSATSLDYPKIYGIRARLESYKKEANRPEQLNQIKALNKRLDSAIKTAHSKYGESKDQKIQTIESEFQGNEWRNRFTLKEKLYYLKETKSYLKTLQSPFGNKRIKKLKQQINEAGQEFLTLLRNQSLNDVLASKREEPRIEMLAFMRQNFRVYQEMVPFFKVPYESDFYLTFYNFLDIQLMRLEKLDKGGDDDFVFMKAKVAKLDSEVKKLPKSGQCSHLAIKNHLKDFNQYQKYYDDRVEFLKAKSGKEDYRLQRDMQTLQADLAGIKQSLDACRYGSGSDPEFDKKMAARRAMQGNQ